MADPAERAIAAALKANDLGCDDDECSIELDASALLGSLSDSGHILVERVELDRLRAVEAAARAVLDPDLSLARSVTERSLRAAFTRKQP